MEPISPELALVDPEARAAALPQLPLPADPPRAAPPRQPEPRSLLVATGPVAFRAIAVLLLLSLGANGYFVARAVVAAGRPRSGAAPVIQASEAAPEPLPPAASAARALLVRISRTPRSELPAALVDDRTGLAKSDLQATCRRAAAAFLCVLRSAGKSAATIQARYSPSAAGAASLKWYSGRNRTPSRTG